MNSADVPTTDATIFSRLVTFDQPGDVVIAERMLNWKFPQNDQDRMQELLDKNDEGTLSADEREELEAFARVGRFLNVIQAKARLSLKNR